MGWPMVVVVEDEPVILEVVQETLELEGFGSTGFNRPFRLAELTVEPDLFLLDLMVPDQSGIELAATLRRAGFATVPIIAMSASSVLLTTAANTGLFQDTLAKPFQLDDLVERVGRYVVPAP